MSLTKKRPEELQWQLIGKNWPGLFFILDPELNIIDGSKAIFRTLKTSEGEIRNNSIIDFYTSFDSREPIDDLKWRLSLEYIYCTGESHKMNIRKLPVKADGGGEAEKFFCPVNIPIHDDNKKLIYIIHQLEEVNPPQERRIGDSFDIISIINDGIYEIDIESKGVRWNDQLYKMLGYGEGEIHLDLRRMLRLIHEEDRRRVLDLIESKKRFAPGFEMEFRLKTKSGAYLDIVSKGVITRNSNGSPLKLTATIHDITSYKTHEKLKVQLELITDIIPAMICYIDSDLRYQFLNPAYQKLLSKPIHDMTGRSIRDALSEEEYQEFLPKALKALEGNKFEVEASSTVNGKTCYIKSWYRPDKDNDHVRGFIVLTIDVTAQKNKELALNRATAEKHQLLEQLQVAHQEITKEKDLLKNFFMKAPAIIAIHEGPKFILKFLNKNAAQFYRDWVGESFSTIKNPVVYKKIMSIFNNVYHQKKEYAISEFKISGPIFYGRDNQGNSEREIFLDLVVQPTFDRNGHTKGIILYAKNVTDLVLAKRAMENNAERNRMMLDALPTITCIYDAKGDIEYTNAEWYAYTGQDRKDSLIEGLAAALHPEDMSKNNIVWKNCMDNKLKYDEYVRIKDKSGTYRWHHHSVIPVKDEEGAVIRWVGTATNIDDEIKANEKKDEFIGIASHELKTPLTSLKAYIQLAQEQLTGFKDELVKTYLNKAFRNTDKLHDLISELLDVSRIQSGTMQLDIKPFNFDDMVKDVVEINQYASATHCIKLTGRTGLSFRGDKERLEQILNNLISNAIKYSPGKNEIRVNRCYTDKHVLVEVTDFGIGISKHEQRKLFGQFYRAKNVSKGAGGLGIGLYISLAFARAHGGHIDIRSEEGKGSTFTLILPRAYRYKH